MANNNYEKRRLTILRAALIVIGGGMGYLALWQYFLYYPDLVRREYQIVITTVSMVLTAAIFGLSGKAVYRLIASITDALRSFGGRVGMRGIIAVVLGLGASAGLVTVFDIGIKHVVDIWAVRLLADILAYILFASCCCACFVKWLNAPRSAKPNAPALGYLISAECFLDERALTAVDTLINAKVCDGAYKALCLYDGERGVEGAKIMDALIKSGALTVVHTDKSFDGKARFAEIEKKVAAAKRLRRVCIDAQNDELDLSAFALPGERIKNAMTALCSANDITNDPEHISAPESAQDDVVNGQIIIDK